MLKFATKNALGIFEEEFSENYFHILNQHAQIYLIANLREKTKIPKVGTKKLGIFRVELENNLVIF